jgi:hypothetical protein
MSTAAWMQVFSRDLKLEISLALASWQLQLRRKHQPLT